MPRDNLTLILEGSTARNGNIPADVFVAKLRQFVATIYSFDRAYAGRSKRGVELEVTDLRKINPALVHFNPRSAVKGYDAQASLHWTVEQMKAIHSGVALDKRVTQDALDNVIDLATIRRAKLPPLSALRVEFGGDEIRLDERIIGGALIMRSTRKLIVDEIWKAGVSRGSIIGDLRGATDIQGEKNFWIEEPNGHITQCVFPEDLRASVQENLWRPCRVHGFLRYRKDGPRPYLIEAEKIEPLTSEPPHLTELKGVFRGLGGGSDVEELIDER